MNAATCDLDGLVFEPVGQAQSLVVIMHGLGSSAAAMSALAKGIADALPTAAVVVPDGFEPFDTSVSGRQWFSVRGVTPANRGDRVAAVLPSICAAIDGLRQKYGVLPQRIALVGFSQGAIVALQIAATLALPAAVVALAGRLATPVTFSGKRPAMLFSHGTDDGVISIAEGEHAAQAFEDAGYPVEFQAIPGHGHSISDLQIAKTAAFLQACLDLERG